MCKKLLVFSIAFGLGLAVWQVVLKITPIEFISNTANLSEEAQTQENDYSQAKLNNSSGIISTQISLENNRKFKYAGADSDKEVEDFYLKFQKAIAENDRKIVAAMMNYPLRVYLPNDCSRETYRIIKNQKHFLKIYDDLFDEKLKILIAQIDVKKNDEDNLWAKYDGIAVGRGDIWIGVYCFKNNCDGKEHFIKIRTIHGNNFRC